MVLLDDPSRRDGVLLVDTTDDGAQGADELAAIGTQEQERAPVRVVVAEIVENVIGEGLVI